VRHIEDLRADQTMQGNALTAREMGVGSLA